MNRMIFIFAVFFLFPLTLAAQQNELGVFLSAAKLDETSFTDSETGVDLQIGFDEDLGYGVSYSRYFSDRVSVELALQKLGGDVELSVSGPDLPPFTADAGEMDLTAISATARWHFARPSARFTPYIGAGVARVTGEVGILGDPEDPESSDTIDLESETTWLANAGIDFRLTPNLSLAGDVKYIAYEPKEDGVPDEERIEVNPLVISASVKFRF